MEKIVIYKNVALLFLLSISIPAVAGIKCSDVKYGNEKYHENMEELAKQAHLQDNYYNRYHEDAVKFLCAGEVQEVRQLVDDGFVKSSEIESIKKVLGKDDRSEQGQSYGYSKQKFLNIGLCSSCADNVAQYYTKEPTSQCGELAKYALEGNPGAVEELKKFPSYCTWKYETVSGNETWQEKTESSVSNEQLEHAKNQVSEAMKDPRKVRLMECMGINPWEVKPAGWVPPTKEECTQIQQVLSAEANAREQSSTSNPTAKSPNNIGNANQCLQGVRAAYEAYTMTVYDAKNPPIQELSRALDFRLSQQPFPASADHAAKSLAYIIKRLQESGVRSIQDGQVDFVVEEYVKNVCSKLR
jgi:hypothetical protein